MPRRTRLTTPTTTTPEKASGPAATKQLAHPLAWETALREAGGDASRLRVENYTTVWINRR